MSSLRGHSGISPPIRWQDLHFPPFSEPKETQTCAFSPLTSASTTEHLAPVAFSCSCRPEERGNPFKTPPWRRKSAGRTPNSRPISAWSRSCCSALLPSCSLSSGKRVGFGSGFGVSNGGGGGGSHLQPQPGLSVVPWRRIGVGRTRPRRPGLRRSTAARTSTTPPFIMKQSSSTHSGWRLRGSTSSACPRFAGAPHFSWRAPLQSLEN